jgi:hypothetical protein
MPITERGRIVTGNLDERGRFVFGSLDERGNFVFGAAAPPSGQLYTVNLNDTVSLTELLARLASKSIADTINLSDTKTKLTGRNYADSVGVTDGVNKTTSKTKADSINLSDGLYKKFMVAIADTVNLGDNAQADGKGTRGVNLSDSVVISDAIVKRVINISRSDTVTLGESDSQGSTKKLLDQITATDTITTNKGKAVLLSDSITVSDAIFKVVKRFAADNITLSETTSKAANMSLKLYDVIVTTDTLQTYLPNAPELIGRIRLNGSNLNVYLTGSNKPINLKGGIDN